MTSSQHRGRRYLVIGAGVGKAIAYFLLTQQDSGLVVLADRSAKRLQESKAKIDATVAPQGRFETLEFDVDDKNSYRIFEKFDVVVSAVPARYTPIIVPRTIAARVHFCDLGGVVDITRSLLAGDLVQAAERNSVSVGPDNGLMPGTGIIFSRLLARGHQRIRVYVGGLPQKPRPPLFYQRVFSLEGLKRICYDRAPVLTGGRIVWRDPFSDYERFGIEELARFSPSAHGEVEAFTTAGSSVAPWTFSKIGVKDFVEKTIRWPGFADFVREIPEHDFENRIASCANIPVDPKNPDLVWMRVEALDGAGKAVKTISLLDLFDSSTGLSAMERTTGFPAAIIARMMACGMTKTGVHTPETLLDDAGRDYFVEEMRKHFNIIFFDSSTGSHK